MHPFFRSLQARVSPILGRIRTWINEHRALALVFSLGVCFFIIPQITYAGFFNWLANGAAEQAFNLVTFIVAALVQFVAWVFTYIVDIFLGFARYNGFADAQPVKLGWVIVRDICNMFFIVILLISAFSTIIGWDSSLRYNAVVPKLLLMAVLINFSRTLIQVLIDFSQVVMLTFVNAFRAAGAGNFTSAFRINKLLSMRDDVQRNVGGGGDILADQNFDTSVQVFTSFLLALVLVVIATGVMLIMTAFVLARIIGLWMALIFSPAAFFVTALPGRLQSGLSSFSGKYWSRLGGMLTGGPVVMFFIYLTFAILQTAPVTPPATPAATGQTPTAPAASEAGTGTGLSGQLGLYSPDPAALAGGAQTTFLTAVGTSDDVASFIVAVALMLMALEAAIEAANAVDSSVGKFATSVGSASKGLAFGAAALAASSPWIASKFAGRTIDKRYDFTGKASTAGLLVANKVPILGQYARKPLVAGMMMRRREAQAERDEMKKAQAGATNNERRLIEAGQHSIIGSALGNVADKLVDLTPEGSTARRVTSSLRKNIGGAWHTMGDQLALMDSAGELTSDASMAADQREEEKRVTAQLKREDIHLRATDKSYKGKSDIEIEEDAKEKAANTVRQRVAEQLDLQKTMAERSGDYATLDAIKAARKKNPLLWTTPEERRKKIGAMEIEDVAKIDESVGATTEFLMNFGLGHGGLEMIDGNVVVSSDKMKRDKLIERVAKVSKKTAKKMEAFFAHIENSSTTSLNEATGTTETKAGLEESIAVQGRMDVDENGDIRFVRTPSAGASLLRKGVNSLENVTKGYVKLPLVGRAEGVSLFGDGGMAELMAATGGPDGRILRNTKEATALNALKARADNGNMDEKDATGKSKVVAELESFYEAGGRAADLKQITDITKAYEALGSSLAAEAATMIKNDGNGLEIEPSRRQDYQKFLKKFSFLKQLNNEGTDSAVAEPMLKGMASKMSVGGSVGGDFLLTDLFVFGNTAQPGRQKYLADDPGFALLSIAKRAENDVILERAREVQGHPNDAVRKRLSGVARRALSLESDTEIR